MVFMLFVYACALQILSTGKSVQKRQERETKENQRQKMKKLFQTLNDPDQIHPLCMYHLKLYLTSLKVVVVR